MLEFLEVMSEAMKPETKSQKRSCFADFLGMMDIARLLFLGIYTMIHSLPYTQYVVMAQLHRVVDLRLPEPGLFVPGGEDLDGHALPHPRPPPHFPIAALACEEAGG